MPRMKTKWLALYIPRSLPIHLIWNVMLKQNYMCNHILLFLFSSDVGITFELEGWSRVCSTFAILSVYWPPLLLLLLLVRLLCLLRCRFPFSKSSLFIMNMNQSTMLHYHQYNNLTMPNFGTKTNLGKETNSDDSLEWPIYFAQHWDFLTERNEPVCPYRRYLE